MRTVSRAVGLLAILGLVTVTMPSAWGQSSPSGSGLRFELTPYMWLPSLDSTFRYPVRGGGSVTTTLSTSPGDYLTHINFTAMMAGEVRYDRFSLVTDILYINANTQSSRLRSYDFGLTQIPVDRTVTTTTSLRLQNTVWTLAGGYTVFEGDWGNVDLLVGFRMLAASQTTNYSLSAAITRPDGSIALGRIGSLSGSDSVWNAIGGMRGRLYLANADWFGGGRIFLPFYFDIGTGGSDITWQVFGGIGYQTERVGVSIGYRYLSFNQGSNATIQKLQLGGPLLAASFRF